MSLNGFVGDKIGAVTDLGGIFGDVSDIGNSLGGLLEGGSGAGAGIGEALGGIGGALGGILGGGSGGGSILGTTVPATYDVNDETVGYIDIVPAATDYTTTLPSASTTQEAPVNETVDFAATKNPYTKPTAELKGGDKGDSVKWMQWIFIYTRYGLKDNGITGVFDEDTMAVVKKLQRDNGLPVDGVVNYAVVDKIELLYFQSIYSTTAPALSTAPQSTEDVTIQQEEKNDFTEKTSIVVLLVIVVVLWVAIIVFAVVLFVLKKKKRKNLKKTKGENNSAEKSVDEAPKGE
jgi:peptidoglycan hydrolase-like protein with peptidoglycan-binding domain